jgi:hypothetical protein
MRLITLASLALLMQSNPIVAPIVTHKDESYTQHVDRVTRTCPPGYEGHYVDQKLGFDSDYWAGGTGFVFSDSGTFTGGPPYYTICFDKKFMDEIRKNRDLSSQRPLPPRGV